MSGIDSSTGMVAGARVLVLGRSPEVLETVMRELAALGVAAAGSVEAEQAAERFDATAFDLIAFGRGLVGPLSERLRRKFARRNPKVRFLDTYAPLAVRQIVAALAGTDGAPPVDLDAYCERIGYDGPRTPTIETLRALHELHPAAIPFEAIDVLLGRGVDLAPAAIDAKLIHGRRGGYCFEHNGLLGRVLTALGFKVEGLVGRVLWMAPPGAAPRPRTHMALRVTIDGEPWLADVGFGGCVPTAPLRLSTSEPQPTRHGDFRVVPFGASLRVQARLGEAWASLYELSREPQLDVDYEPANWFTATHPGSLFRQNLIVARTTPQARYALLNARLTVRTPDGREEREVLSAERLEQALAGLFALPVEPAWRPLIERAAAMAS